MDTVQPPPVEVTDIYWGEAPQDAIAEAEAVQDLPRDPHLILRLSAQFFRLSPSSQIVTLLHETIRMSLDLTGKRLQQADDLSKGHFQGKTRSEQAFETQRIQLARSLYLFPDEVMAEKHLQKDYPAFAADRLGHYNDIQGRASENRDYQAAECQGRSKIRPPWRRKTRPLGSWVEWRNAAVRRGRQDAGVAAGWRAFLLCSRR